MLDTERYKNFIELNQKKKEIEQQLKEIKKQIETEEIDLIDQLLDNDMEKISINGRTVYINSKIYAQIHNKQKAIEILKAEGFEDYVKPSYNTNQISTMLREFDEKDEELPDSFAGIIEPYLKQKLCVIKS